MERGSISLGKSREASVNYIGKGEVEGVGEGGDGCGGGRKCYRMREFVP